ncbi:MAG: TIR domain-containing protein [Polyangiaceae bacterium]
MPNVDVHELHQAVIAVGISRDALLSGVDRQFVAMIQRLPSRSEQILEDLNQMESAGTLTNGTWPLRSWLLNAVRLSALRKEELVFRKALEALDPGSASPKKPTVTEERATVTDRRPAVEASVLIYISAAPADKPFVEKLRKHLSPLASIGVRIWDRTQLRGGDLVSRSVDQNLAAAKVVVPILSADYLADQVMLGELTAASRRSDVDLVPVLARACLWNTLPELDNREILPSSKKPIQSMSDVDSALASVAQEIGDIVSRRIRGTGAPTPANNPPAGHDSAPAKPSFGREREDESASAGGSPSPPTAYSRFISDPKLTALCTALLEHIRTTNELTSLAERAGIQIAGRMRDGRPRDACEDMMRLAFQQRLVPQLLRLAATDVPVLEADIEAYLRGRP